MRRTIALAALSVALTSCVGTTFVIANRSNYDGTRNEAATYGNINNPQTSGGRGVNAEKTTDVDTKVAK